MSRWQSFAKRADTYQPELADFLTPDRCADKVMAMEWVDMVRGFTYERFWFDYRTALRWGRLVVRSH